MKLGSHKGLSILERVVKVLNHRLSKIGQRKMAGQEAHGTHFNCIHLNQHVIKQFLVSTDLLLSSFAVIGRGVYDARVVWVDHKRALQF